MGGFVLSSYHRSKHVWVLYSKKHPLAPGCRAVLYLLHIVIIYLFIHSTWTSRVLFHKHQLRVSSLHLPPLGAGHSRTRRAANYKVTKICASCYMDIAASYLFLP